MAKLLGETFTKIFCKNVYFNSVKQRESHKLVQEIKKDIPVVVLPATKNEYPEILSMMWTSYYPHEPTTNYLGLGNKYNPAMDDCAMKTLTQGLTLVAKCKITGKIIGACLNEAASKWDSDLMDRLASTVSCKKTKQLFHFWAYVQRAPQLYEKFNVDTIFEIQCIFVEKNHRRKGIATVLLEKSRNFGLDNLYPLIRVDATNVKTVKICEKYNMEKVYEIPFESYVGPNKEHIFHPDFPNLAVHIFIEKNKKVEKK